MDESPRPKARPDDAGPVGLRPRARPADRSASRTWSIGEIATRFEALPLDRTALVGLFYGPEGETALVRERDGRLRRVVAGSLVDGGRVSRILRDGIRLVREDGAEEVLTLPG